MAGELESKVALITGASRGIGEAIARALFAAGASVALVSRKQPALDTIAKDLDPSGARVMAMAAHTGDPEAIEDLVQAVADRFGGIDVVVNNAATNPHFGPILSSEGSHWDKTFEVNVRGYFELARASVPHMKRGGGSIINVASVAAEHPLPGMGVYCVSKAAVLMLTDVLAAELASVGIRVNAVLPGFVKTEFSRVLWEDEARHEQLKAMIPQRRIAEPEEIAPTVVFLASSASSFMTGAHLRIDGGQLVGTPGA